LKTRYIMLSVCSDATDAILCDDYAGAGSHLSWYCVRLSGVK